MSQATKKRGEGEEKGGVRERFPPSVFRHQKEGGGRKKKDVVASSFLLLFLFPASVAS